MNYTIASIPTIYRGRRYRSRLEARWAAFFDLLGWAAEYEPNDLGSWSPDFELRSQSGGEPVLVEVKPISLKREEAFPVMMKMITAIQSYENSPTLLLLPKSPIFAKSNTVLGWVAKRKGEHREGFGGFLSLGSGGRFQITLKNEKNSLSLWKEGSVNDRSYCAQALWIEASNIVQWRPKDVGLS